MRAGVETQPVAAIAFGSLSGDRPFCIRSADGKDLAIVRLIEAGPGGGSVTVEMSHHRSAG